MIGGLLMEFEEGIFAKEVKLNNSIPTRKKNAYFDDTKLSELSWREKGPSRRVNALLDSCISK